MVRIGIGENLWGEARSHLDVGAERLGFFLADWSDAKRSFVVRSWRAVRDDASGRSDSLHISLSDELRAEIIQWAASEEACLIEAHSHGRWAPAAFSLYDLQHLEEWVSHLWWRLQRRPYAAIVTSTSDFDALAWIGSPLQSEQVIGLTADGFLPATGATLSLEKQDRP
jgi:hypothetical protein